jgi:Acetyltransferase (GNAT) domain
VDYHADRFADASLLFFRRDELVGVMPANLHGTTLFSHGGLTFGGILSGPRLRTELMLSVFSALRGAAREIGADRVVYKAIPHIYHRQPAEEDLYALARYGANLIRRDISSVVQLGEARLVSERRRRALEKARAHGVQVQESDDFETFLGIQKTLLNARFGVDPTHTPKELMLLHSRFPESIKLYSASLDGRIVGGVVVYADKQVARAQYIAASEEGKASAALDMVFALLIDEVYVGRRYFDFGISTEKDGRHLNASLIENKESYGARAIVYDWYELSC